MTSNHIELLQERWKELKTSAASQTADQVLGLSSLEVLLSDCLKAVADVDYALDRAELQRLAREIADGIYRISNIYPAAIIAPFRQSMPVEVWSRGLPNTNKYLFGREDELRRLDEAWKNPGTNVITIVALGGVGKSTLVNRWLEAMRKDEWRGAERVFGWSFSGQGEMRVSASSDQFVGEAFKWFGGMDRPAGAPPEQGHSLAQLIRRQRTLLGSDNLGNAG